MTRANDAAHETGGAWRARVTGDGTFTLVHPLHGQACHSSAGAWLEARERYVAGARIPERLREPGRTQLALLDVGTGLGLNLAALFERARSSGVALRVLTLERDVAVLERAFELFAGDGPAPRALDATARDSLRAVHAALARALASRAAVPFGPRGRLELRVGDARRTLAARPPAERFDAVFLDPFSPGVEPELWEPRFLREIARRMAAGSVLATYCAATRVRVALAACGLRVGAGTRLGRKAEGTLAAPDVDLAPLAPRVARRLARRAPELCRELGWPVPAPYRADHAP